MARRGIGGDTHRCAGWSHTRASARPILAKLAGAGTCGDGQHRAGLPADQQIVQFELLRTGLVMGTSINSFSGRIAVSRAHSLLAYQLDMSCLLYTSPSPRDGLLSRM